MYKQKCKILNVIMLFQLFVTGQQMGMEKIKSKKPKEWPPSLSSPWP